VPLEQEKAVKISLAQMHCAWGDIPRNLKKVEDFAARAADDKADGRSQCGLAVPAEARSAGVV